ncbi:UNVERIFIED_CONTAM: hypothetical protein HDU68_004013, partial [Siphonaria sp. JEL0065]
MQVLTLIALLSLGPVIHVRSQTSTTMQPTKTTTAAPTTVVEATVDPLSLVSVVAGVAIPSIVAVVYTISSWAAAQDPCINNCLNKAPAVNINDPASTNQDLISTCSTSCPGNTLITALVNVCGAANKQGAVLSAVPEASRSSMPT